MKTKLFAVALLMVLAVGGIAASKAYAWTTCTTSCFGNSCTTNCY